MNIQINVSVLDGSWWRKGCAIKLLVHLVETARLRQADKVVFNRRTVASEIDESEWAVRKAFEQLVEKGIVRQISAQRKVGTTIAFTGSYVRLVEDTLPNTAQTKGKKRSTSPKSLPNPAQINGGVTDSKSDGSEQSDGAGSPKSRPNTAQIKDKETTKESFPHTPYIENKKETECPTGRVPSGPDAQPPLNQRARLCFEEVFRSIYHSEYYWTAKDAGQMTQLLKKISFSREKRKTPLPNDDDSLIEALKKFLTSINKDWISNNFSVSMIASHYNEIISEIKNRNNGQRNNTDAATVARRTEIASRVATYDEQWKKEHGAGADAGQ